MKPPHGMPLLLYRLVRWLLPDERAEDVLGDLEEAHAWRCERLGAHAANRRLWRDAAALLFWGMASHMGRMQSGTMGRDFLQDFGFAVRILTRDRDSPPRRFSCWDSGSGRPPRSSRW